MMGNNGILIMVIMEFLKRHFYKLSIRLTENNQKGIQVDLMGIC